MQTVKQLTPALISVLLITGMVVLSETVGEPEIIFPEIAAIATGAMLAPRLSWRTSKIRIFLFLMIAAVLGMAIVAFVPAPLPVQMILAYILAQVLLAASQTSFAPMVSAIVLPVMLQSRSLWYLVSAALFTGMILIAREAIERAGIRRKEEYTPVPVPHSRPEMVHILKKILFASLVIIAALGTGWRFMAAPPILVAFTEIANSGAGPRKFPVRTIALCTLCAATGAISRLVIAMHFGLPLALAALISSAAAVILIHAFDLFVPPAAALMLLAMLVPESAVALYPLEAGLGIAVFMGISLLFMH